MIQWEKMKVIMTKTMLHEIKQMSILYTHLVLADCLSYPDLMHANVKSFFFTMTQLNGLYFGIILIFVISECLNVCMYVYLLPFCYVRYLRLTRTVVFSPKDNYLCFLCYKEHPFINANHVTFFVKK